GLRSLLLVFDVICLVLSAWMYAQHDIWGYAFYGNLCTLIVHIPIVFRVVPALSMWGVLAFVVTIGSGIRGISIAVGYPNRAILTSIFTQGVRFSDLRSEAILTLPCVLSLTVGFMATARNR